MKKITMKNICFAASAVLFFAACGDNVTDNSPVATQAYANQDAFPECDKAYEGMFATITSSKELYICTAEKWINLSKGGADGNSAGKSACSAKELENESGVEITCNGEVVDTLNYGKTGDKGSTGGTGDQGDKGSKGSDGSNFTGSTPTWNTDRCKLKNSGFDYMIYECVDSTYVRELPDLSNFNQYVWNPVKTFGATTSGATSYDGGTLKSVSYMPTGSNVSLTRGSTEWTSGTSLVTTDFNKYMTLQIEATAKVVVSAPQTVSAENYRPFVGVGATYSSKNLGDRLGLCVTYSSAKDMGLLLKGESGYLRATLPASDTITMVDVRWFEFAPVAEGVDPDKVISKVSAVYVEAASGDSVGTYENEFTLAQLGDYGQCNDSTFKDVEARIKSIKEDGEPLVVGTITYPTVKIGDQTWMAANLRTPYPYTSKGGSTMAYCISNATALARQGCTYTWAAAMDSASQLHGYASTNSAYNTCGYGSTCSATAPVQGICPSGWHLPSMKDWGTLFVTIRNSWKECNTNDCAVFLYRLTLVSGDDYYESGKNLMGLNFYFADSDEYYWSSKDDGMTTTARSFNFDGGQVIAYKEDPSLFNGYQYNKSNKTYVRCIKN